MPRVKKKKRGGQPSKLGRVELSELVNFARDNIKLYNQADSFALNYAKKKLDGVFHKGKAITGLANSLVPNVIKLYNKEYGATFDSVSGSDKKKLAQKLLGWVNDLRDDIIRNEPFRLPKRLRKELRK